MKWSIYYTISDVNYINRINRITILNFSNSVISVFYSNLSPNRKW